jgi:DNA-binding NarL/FixJ family response regulator
MSEQLKIMVVNVATGEVIERPITADELAQRESDIAVFDLWKSEQNAKQTARESALAKLAALGLTADEVAAL